ncbi:hypothetical protein MMC18_000289 [Xylographa bjoerkii]|nr:hypothetical protein [Xylographa bjoerkii]
MVCRIHSIVTTIPGQIERQQPVNLIDALGKYSPFHLEFIRSAEALTAVLKANLSKVRCGPAKIDRGEFAIQDTSTKRQIRLSDDWDTCFFPGQHVDMSMIFNRRSFQRSCCPGCGAIQMGHENEDIDCSVCGTTFRRVVEPFYTKKRRALTSTVARGTTRVNHILFVSKALQNRPREPADDIKLFRRVRVTALDVGNEALITTSENAKDIAEAFKEFYHTVPVASDEIAKCISALQKIAKTSLQLVDAGGLPHNDGPKDSTEEWGQAVLISLDFTFKDINQLFGLLADTVYNGPKESYQGAWEKMALTTSDEALANRLEKYFVRILCLLEIAKRNASPSSYLEMHRYVADTLFLQDLAIGKAKR